MISENETVLFVYNTVSFLGRNIPFKVLNSLNPVNKTISVVQCTQGEAQRSMWDKIKL